VLGKRKWFQIEPKRTRQFKLLSLIYTYMSQDSTVTVATTEQFGPSTTETRIFNMSIILIIVTNNDL
jgi:hypothetical protein